MDFLSYLDEIITILGMLYILMIIFSGLYDWISSVKENLNMKKKAHA